MDIEQLQQEIAQAAHEHQVSPFSLEEIRLRIAAVESELQKRLWLYDPADWVETRLGEFMWSKQKIIAQSLVMHRHTAVPSCFASGKSWLAARLAAWWLDIHKGGDAFVVTTATTGAQVKAILWREIGRAFAHGNLPGRVNQTEWHMVNPDTGKEELVAFGRKPGDLDATAFQGIHAPYVLVIFDEAAGISQELFDAGDSLAANEDSRILAIGNPEDGGSEFADVCKPGSGWNVIRIKAWDTPNFSGEEVPDALRKLLISRVYVEEKRRRWGEQSPMWQAKILAEFPDVREDGLIPIKAIRLAQARRYKVDAKDISELGVDVGAGHDKNVCAHRHGLKFRVIRRDQQPDTMRSCGNLIADLEATGASVAKVDEIGIGRGLVDRAREQRKPVIGVNVGRKAKDDKHYVNLRAEAYWALREMFTDAETEDEVGIDIDPRDEDLAAQLVELRFKRTSSGKIQIESKDEMKKRGMASPDDADAIMLAGMSSDLVPRPIRKRKVRWG
jgi:hypothetical protein